MADNGTGGQPPISQPVAGPSVCPRHPDREAYVRCQRCLRPACPECQRPAAVGIQCVDCVKAAAKASPQARTIFGGRATDGTPVVTYAIIAICAVVFVAQMVSPNVTDDFVDAPYLGWVEPWRMLSANFLHSTYLIPHIFMNMIALWQLGPYLEQLLGHARFLALYLISGLGGSVAVTLLAPVPDREELLSTGVVDGPWFTGTLGASGAVFGLFGAVLVFNRALNRSSSVLYGVLAINAVIGFVYPLISWQAHLGGFVTGAACAGVIALFRSRAVRHFAWFGLVGVLALVIVAGAAKYLTVPEDLRTLTGVFSSLR